MSEDKRLNEVIRVQRKPSSFVTMDKGFLENPNLSWKAKGILAYLLSKPDSWKVIVSNIINNASDGKGAVYKGLAELKEFGYYEKSPIRDEKGVIVRWDSVVLEVPYMIKNAENMPSCPLPKNQEMDNQEMENQDIDNPYLENREHSNNYLNKNNLNNINSINNQSSQVLSAQPQAQTTVDKSDQTDQTEDIERKIESYRLLIHDNISYGDLSQSRRFDMCLVDEFVAIILDVVMSEGKYVRIGNEDKPRELVKSVLLKLTHDHIEHAIDQFKGVTERISKKKQYILTMLYNASMELDAHRANRSCTSSPKLAADSDGHGCDAEMERMFREGDI